MCSFLESLFRQFERPDSPENIVIVSHGTAIKFFRMRWHHWTSEKFEALPQLPNCNVLAMEMGEAGVSVLHDPTIVSGGA